MTQPQTTAASLPTFDELYEEYYRPLVRYTLSKMRGISEQDAQDMVEDVWVRIFLALPSRDPKVSTMGAWVYSCMRNEIIDRIRQRRTRGTAILDLDEHDEADEGSELEILTVLSDEVMGDILAVLDTEQALLIELVYVRGWRLNEVAQDWCRTLDAIKKLHRRALGRIRTYIETGSTRRKRRSTSAA